MSGYIGTQPVPQATQHREAFTATASQTSFPTAGYTPQFVDVYLNGVKLAAADYTATNGSDIVLTAGAALNDILEYVAYTPFEVANQTFTGTTTTDVLVATGNVGIGTASPSAQLELSSATDYSGLKVSGTNHKLIAIETSTSNRQVLTSYKSGSHEYSIGLGTSDEFSFYDNTSAAERMRIDSSGHVIIPAGVTLGTAAGVYSAANTLDDYEEGTWTPVLSSGTFSSYNATYTKIGQLVRIGFDCYIATGGASIIYGLPFTPADTTGFTPYFALQDLPTGCLGMGWAIGGGAPTIYVRSYKDNESFVQTGLSSGANIHVDFTYRTTS